MLCENRKRRELFRRNCRRAELRRTDASRTQLRPVQHRDARCLQRAGGNVARSVGVARRRAAEGDSRHVRGELGERDAPVGDAALRHVLHCLDDLLERRLDVVRRKAGNGRDAELRRGGSAGQLVEQGVELLPHHRRYEIVEHLLVLRRRAGQLVGLALHAAFGNGGLRDLLFLYAHVFTSSRNCPSHNAL